MMLTHDPLRRTDMHPAAVHDVSPEAMMSAAAQSALRPPPVPQSAAIVRHGMLSPPGYARHVAIRVAFERVEVSL